jgi:hypothetical protein
VRPFRPEGVRPDGLADAGPGSDLPDDPGGAGPVQPPPVRTRENRSPLRALRWPGRWPARYGGERDGDDLAAPAGDHQGPVPSLDAKGFNVGASGFGDPKPGNLSEQVWGISR